MLRALLHASRVPLVGPCVLFAGSAGTGKSYLLRTIIAGLRSKLFQAGQAGSVYVTASTGIAACAIGGTTLHSFAGIGLGEASAEDLARKCQHTMEVSARWRRCKALVLDEVSLVAAMPLLLLQRTQFCTWPRPIISSAVSLVERAGVHG